MIPKTIWQIGPYEYEELPSYIKICTESWIEQNPSWTYRYMTNDDAHIFIQDHFGKHYGDLYLKAHVPMCQADFWRYLVLYRFGGVYVDLDMLAMVPIEKWFNLDAEISVFASSLEDIIKWNAETYDQWMIGSTKHNQGMLSVIQSVANRIELAESGRVDYKDTGSLVFTKSIKESDAKVFVNDSPPDEIIHYTGSRLWSEGFEGSNISSIYPWVKSRNGDLRVLHNAYNSTDGK